MSVSIPVWPMSTVVALVSPITIAALASMLIAPPSASMSKLAAPIVAAPEPSIAMVEPERLISVASKSNEERVD